MKQVLIKKTGEILDVVSEFSMIQISINLPFDFPDKDFKEKLTETWTHDGLGHVKMTTGKDREDYYVLSNGKTYEVDDLAVGLDEIRDWKLKNDLNI